MDIPSRPSRSSSLFPRARGARLARADGTVVATALAALAAAGLSGCAKDPAPKDALGGPGVTTPTPDAATPASAPATVEGKLTVSLSGRTPIPPLALGLNYWSWTYGLTLAGSETAVTALGPKILRIGGHNNDTNSPSPFSEAEIDRAVAYARTVGAEPILQVPILADVNAVAPTADTAAQMVRYTNTTKAYGVKYFSIGNEPDLYADPTQSPPHLLSYTADSYCQTAEAFVPAMRAVDPTIQIVGPDLSWKYQDGANDWLSPILANCGDLFDVVSIHRYPIAPTATSRTAAAADAAAFHATIEAVRKKMAAAGQGAKPLALTEANITWNGDPAMSTLEASPGTLPAGLWVADTLGTGLSEGLWTTAIWSIRESWTFGILTPDNVARPAYRAVALFSQHFGTTMLAVTSAPTGVHAYASRNAADDGTALVIVNWTDNVQKLSVAFDGATTSLVPPATVLVQPMTMNAVQIPDDGGDVVVWPYGPSTWQSRAEPSPITSSRGGLPNL